MNSSQTLKPQAGSEEVLASRYGTALRERLNTRIQEQLRPGVRVLDLGAGTQPTIPPHARPPGCTYVAVDNDVVELEKAPPGSYDETVLADATQFIPRLEEQFDLIVSAHVLEHVSPLNKALDNCYRYLRPRGELIALFSGRFAAFAIINRIIPRRLGQVVMERFLDRESETMFRGVYDRTYSSALPPLLDGWTSWQITPLYLGAGYFAFNDPLRKMYLAFEDWAARTGRANLATYYILEAER
jgi:SAM-dependent methyltransferase